MMDSGSSVDQSFERLLRAGKVYMPAWRLLHDAFDKPTEKKKTKKKTVE